MFKHLIHPRLDLRLDPIPLLNCLLYGGFDLLNFPKDGLDVFQARGLCRTLGAELSDQIFEAVVDTGALVL